MLKYEDACGLGVSIAFDSYDRTELRQTYAYRIYDVQTGDTLHEGADLRCGSNEDAPLAKMLATFLGFVSAWCDSLGYEERSGRDGENADMFPRTLLDKVPVDTWQTWADQGQDSVYGFDRD